MTDYGQLMGIFSCPRPNGSRAERETLQAILEWLDQRGISYRVQKFRVYPYYFEAIGIWLIASRLSLALATWTGQGWAALILAAIGLVGGTLDAAFHIPLITWLGAREGQNVLVEFGSPPDPNSQEIIISAHYDSKTELLDHSQRMFFLRNVPTGIVLTIIVGILSPLTLIMRQNDFAGAGVIQIIASVLAAVLLVLAGGYGFNLSLGRLVEPSSGAVDNGAACVILLGLAANIQQEMQKRTDQILPPNLHLTLALFTGEEVDRQGSRAFVHWRGWAHSSKSVSRDSNQPSKTALNLEIMAQNGPYVVWDQEGSVFGLKPTSANLNKVLSDAIQQVTGKLPEHGGPITSDGASFLEVGIPTAVLGTYDQKDRDRGFHRPSDHINRVAMERLPEGVQLLEEFIQRLRLSA